MPRRVWEVLRLPPLPTGPQTALVVLAGLPGTGKSHLAAAVAAQRSVVILRTDTVRKVLVPHPTYSSVESGRVYHTCHTVIRSLLAKGYPTLFDATNLTEQGRRRLRCLASDAGASYLLVWVEAPPDVVQDRLADRAKGAPAYDSDADWAVYGILQATVQRPQQPHLVADTQGALDEAVTAVVGFLDAGQSSRRGVGAVQVDSPKQVA